jgi:hypothetical protein
MRILYGLRPPGVLAAAEKKNYGSFIGYKKHTLQR